MGCSKHLSAQKGQNNSYLCGLLTPQRSVTTGRLPNASHWWLAGQPDSFQAGFNSGGTGKFQLIQRTAQKQHLQHHLAYINSLLCLLALIELQWRSNGWWTICSKVKGTMLPPTLTSLLYSVDHGRSIYVNSDRYFLLSKKLDLQWRGASVSLLPTIANNWVTSLATELLDQKQVNCLQSTVFPFRRQRQMSGPFWGLLATIGDSFRTMLQWLLHWLILSRRHVQTRCNGVKCVQRPSGSSKIHYALCQFWGV